MIDAQLLEQIRNNYHLQKRDEQPILLPTSGMHPVWQLLAQNKKYVLKYYDRELRALYAQNLLPLEQVEQIAAFIQQKNIPTIIAVSGKEGYEFQAAQGSFFLYEWIEAEHKLGHQISEHHACQIGILLHDIHDIKMDAPRHLMTSHHLIDALQIFKNKCLNVLLSEELINLQSWYEQSLSHRRGIDQLVFSHRDVMPANVFWLTDKKCLLLDWEFCGYIQRDLDVFITALNWSYVTSGQIDFNLFSSLIHGYLSQYPQIVFQWDVLLFEYYAYVLHWIEFNLKRAVYFPGQYEQAITEIKKSYIAMNCVTQNYQKLTNFIKKT